MPSSEDEQDDNKIYDKLKSIKAFTVDGLYSLHPDVCRLYTESLQFQVDELSNPAQLLTNHDEELYQNLNEYKQLRQKLLNVKTKIVSCQEESNENIKKVWTITENSERKIGMCQQGKVAETTYKYKHASLNEDKLKFFELNCDQLSELIVKDHLHYSFESKVKRLKIFTKLSASHNEPDESVRATCLKSCIVTLIDFLKTLGDSKPDSRTFEDSKSEFLLQCRKWLRCLIKKFLEKYNTENCRFVISQLSRGPASTADWSADLIECKPFDKVTEFESIPEYISHCCSVLSELFFRLKNDQLQDQIPNINDEGQRRHQANQKLSTTNELKDSWSLIDPRFSCTEELNLSTCTRNILCEADVIKFCIRIPVTQIFRAYVKKCLEVEQSQYGSSPESVMLELLTIGTIIIETHKMGLETFNSIQYGNLIEYLSSQTRTTVIILSEQWAEFKRRLKGVNDAMLMRLQVEYDNFILRSIRIITELRESGIWRHLSSFEPQEVPLPVSEVTCNSVDGLRPAINRLLQVAGLSTVTSSSSHPIQVDGNKASVQASSNSLTYELSVEWFKEVSEPMLWHILWRLHHNVFDSSCEYHSDNYWLDKFREPSVVYVDKMKNSPPGECSYLLNSITSMLLSRTSPDSKLISFIATEIFNLSFICQIDESMKKSITKTGIKSLKRCAEKFPGLISLYLSFISDNKMDENIVDLFKICSLRGWLCRKNELDTIAHWLIERPLNSAHNKIARLIISKIISNSPETNPAPNETQTSIAHSSSFTSLPRRQASNSSSGGGHEASCCFVDLRLRRRIALLLFEASLKHSPENIDLGPKSLGTSVEVALERIFCERNSVPYNEIIELAVDTNFTQLYVWIWRLLFTFRLHILNQPDTDWNDLKSRSGTSRSIKNTVLLNDSFHPAPSVQDSECLLLAEGIRNQNPMASFICIMMTDVSWQSDSLSTCIGYLNNMANSGHLTPSLTTLMYLSICHLNDLDRTIAIDPRCIDYFTTVINAGFDANRIASLIVSQLQHLKQYRQLQLSQFYITVFLSVADSILRKQTISWFSGNEHSLEKIACILDYLVKFNFTTQRQEIIRKFYDCCYALQSNTTQTASWIGSFLPTNSPSQNKRQSSKTVSHLLTQKFKKYFWLRWVTVESDALRLEKVWEYIVNYLSSQENSDIDQAIKEANSRFNQSTSKSLLPIFSWVELIFDIVESNPSHPLCPLIWYNFFLNYFANSLNGMSVGHKIVVADTKTKLLSRLEPLFNYHLFRNRNWAQSSVVRQDSLTELYTAYRLWLQNDSLQDAYVDIDRLRSMKGDPYLVDLLKEVMESSPGSSCVRYIDLQSIETQNRNLSQIWLSVTKLDGNEQMNQMVFIDSEQDESIQVLACDEEHASDATSLIVKYNVTNVNDSRLLANAEDELKCIILEEIEDWKVRPIELTLLEIYKNFNLIFKESRTFESGCSKLELIKSKMTELSRELYTNKKREVVRSVRCADGDDCIGPAKIKFNIKEATIDDLKSLRLDEERRQLVELVEKLNSMPTRETVHATVIIENTVGHLMGEQDKTRGTIESLLKWINDPNAYRLLNGPYNVANQLFKNILEIMSNSNEVDTYNKALVDVCFEHSDSPSVQVLSPHFSPSSCSAECFFELYEKISMNQMKLTPNGLFVYLSKFDVNQWLVKNATTERAKEMHHKMIQTTCEALSRMGKEPDESLYTTLDIYRRHIQIELAPPDRREPDEVALLLEQFLDIMDKQLLWPNLWFEFLKIIGLEKYPTSSVASANHHRADRQDLNRSLPVRGRSPDSANLSLQQLSPNHSRMIDESTLSGLIEHIAHLAECQTLLDYESATKLIQMLSEFVKKKHESIGVTLIENFSDYLDQFSMVMISITFIWLRIMGKIYPDNHELIWRQFGDLWHDWILVSRNCQNVSTASYSLMASQYVSAINYMVYKLPDNTQSILKSVLSNLTQYVMETKEVVYLELTILQRYMKNLAWNLLQLTPDDFENLALLSEQENYNISDLISHIMLQINVKDSLTRIQESEPQVMPRVVERLATTIVLQSSNLKGFHLHGLHFTMIPVESIPGIVSLILPRMESTNLEHNQKNKLLVSLLRFMCIKLDIGLMDAPSQFSQTPDQQLPLADCFERSLIYAKFVSDYLTQLIKNHPATIKNNASYIRAVVENSLQDLKMLVPPEVEVAKKTAIYENLLDCCNNSSGHTLDEEASLMITESLIESQLYKDRPILVMELFHALGQILSSGHLLVFALERLTVKYLAMSGHYEKVWKSFVLTALPGEVYLRSCVDYRAPLAMLVFFEALTHNNEEQDNYDDHNKQDQFFEEKEQDGADEELTHHDDISSDAQTERLAAPPSDHRAMRGNRVWSSFFYWVALLSNEASNNAKAGNETRLVTTWLRLLDLFESHLNDKFLVLLENEDANELVSGDPILSSAESGGNSNLNSSEPSEEQTKQQQVAKTPGESQYQLKLTLEAERKYLLEFIKQLLSIYDKHNSMSIWSYLKMASHSSPKSSLIALAVASFLVDRTLSNLSSRAQMANQVSRTIEKPPTSQTAPSESGQSQLDTSGRARGASGAVAGALPPQLLKLGDELGKLRKACLAKLEAARKSKHYIEHISFIETLIESINRSDKVQYSEGVQLIASFVRSLYSAQASPQVTTATDEATTTTAATTTTTTTSSAPINPTNSNSNNQQLGDAAVGDLVCINKILSTFAKW